MRRFTTDETGSAMTEFIVGLPIFILIFSGVGALHRLNAEGFAAMADAEQQVWRDAVQIQSERLAEPQRLSPLATAGSELFGGGLSLSDALDTASSTSLWVDSGLKADFPTRMLDGTAEAHLQLSEVMGEDELFSHALMNDVADFDGGSAGSGWAGMFGALLDGAGSRPAIAAGYRYGVVRGEATRDVDINWLPEKREMGARFEVAAPTFATHRLYAVALTRLELAQDVRYDEAIQEFNYEVKTASGSDLGEAPQCAGEVSQWALCVESNPGCDDGSGGIAADCPCGQAPSCQDDATNPLQSIFDEACQDTEGVSGCP